MEHRRNTWEATIRLAITASLLAAALAVALHTAGVRSQPVIVLPVIVVCFAASWVRSGRAAGSDAPLSAVRHAVTVRAHDPHPVS